MQRKLGKTAARPNAIQAKFRQFMNKNRWPVPPKAGHGYFERVHDWMMLGNDSAGDCVWAGRGHEFMMLSRIGVAEDCTFRTQDVLSDYSALTGYDPRDPNTDNGTDMQQAASYWQKTGMLTDKGKRVKIDAYVAPKVGDVEELDVALYTFKSVGGGFVWTDKADEQFEAGKPLTYVKGAREVGGHYMPFVGRKGKYFLAVTWGQIVRIDPSWIKAFNDENIVCIDEGMLSRKGATPQGFHVEGLIDFLKEIRG